MRFLLLAPYYVRGNNEILIGMLSRVRWLTFRSGGGRPQVLILVLAPVLMQATRSVKACGLGVLSI